MNKHKHNQVCCIIFYCQYTLNNFIYITCSPHSVDAHPIYSEAHNTHTIYSETHNIHAHTIYSETQNIHALQDILPRMLMHTPCVNNLQ